MYYALPCTKEDMVELFRTIHKEDLRTLVRELIYAIDNDESCEDLVDKLREMVTV